MSIPSLYTPDPDGEIRDSLDTDIPVLTKCLHFRRDDGRLQIASRFRRARYRLFWTGDDGEYVGTLYTPICDSEPVVRLIHLHYTDTLPGESAFWADLTQHALAVSYSMIRVSVEGRDRTSLLDRPSSFLVDGLLDRLDPPEGRGHTGRSRGVSP